MSDKTTEVNAECLELFTKIIDRRTRGAATQSDRFVYKSVQDMLDYVLSGNIDCLAQFDYIE